MRVSQHHLNRHTNSYNISALSLRHACECVYSFVNNAMAKKLFKLYIKISSRASEDEDLASLFLGINPSEGRNPELVLCRAHKGNSFSQHALAVYGTADSSYRSGPHLTDLLTLMNDQCNDPVPFFSCVKLCQAAVIKFSPKLFLGPSFCCCDVCYSLRLL